MALYRVTVGACEYQVDVSANQVMLNGQPVDVQLVPINKGGHYLLLHGMKQKELHVDSYGCCQYGVMVGGRHIVALVEKATGRGGKKTEAVHSGDLLAPMPALIVALRVSEGDAVEKGQVLVVLESMKMQMEFRAPFAGQVKKVAVQPGMHVEKGAFLAQVAKSSEQPG